MPRTLMGVPVDSRALAESGVVSRPGLARRRPGHGAARDPARRPGRQRRRAGRGALRAGGRRPARRAAARGRVRRARARSRRGRRCRRWWPSSDRHRSMMRAAARGDDGARPPTYRSFAGLRGGVGGSRRRWPRPAARPSGPAPRSRPGPGRRRWLEPGRRLDRTRLGGGACRRRGRARHPARATGGCWPTWCRTRLGSWPVSSTRRWPWSRWRSGPATSLPTTGSGFPPGAAGAEAASRVERRHLLFGQVGTGCREAGRDVDGEARCSCVSLHRPAPRGAGAAGRRRRAWSELALGDLARRGRPVGATGRPARAALGRVASPVRRRARGAGAQHPARRRRVVRRRARGVRPAYDGLAASPGGGVASPPSWPPPRSSRPATRS